MPRAGGFVYRDAAGATVRDPEVLARIARLAIPPAWQDVWICADPAGHLQATGRDSRGRKQYRYHPDWSAGRGETKFDGLLNFGAVLPRIRDRVDRVLQHQVDMKAPGRMLVLATLVRLLDTTWLRIGNADYARQNRTYGLSTLRNKHVDVRGDALRLSFVGKSGVRHEVALADRRVARVVRRCRDLPGQELFQYVDDDGSVHRIDSADVNTWLAEAAGRRVTAKDFRTWHGSVLALDLTLSACAAQAAAGGAAPADVRAPATQVLAAVARRLGNTPAVCRKAYIHPQVLELGSALADAAASQVLSDAPWALAPTPRRGLNLPERRLIGLLQHRRRKGECTAA